MINLMDIVEEKRKLLIDYVEGLPSMVNRMIKIRLNEPYMNPSLFHGKERRMSEFSSILRFLPKNDVILINNPDESCYQKEYSKIMFLINNSSYPRNIQQRLVLLMNQESYDYDSMIHIELDIGELLEDYKNYPFVNELADFINENIITYKTKVYDIYSTFVLNTEFVSENLMYHLLQLNRMINIGIRNCDSYIKQRNLSILIYVYLKELGIERNVEKYPFLNRFLYGILHNNNEEISTFVLSKVKEYILEDLSIVNIISELSESDIFSSILNQCDNEFNSIDNTDRVKTDNGLVYLFKDTNILPNDVEELSNQIRYLSKDVIKDYLDPETTADDLSFFLNDNDYGHCIDFQNMHIGTVYDGFHHNIKYLLYYNGDFYLLFKNHKYPRCIFGLSTTSDNGDRKVLRLKESRLFMYKYIPDEF